MSDWIADLYALAADCVTAFDALAGRQIADHPSGDQSGDGDRHRGARFDAAGQWGANDRDQ